MENVRTGNMKMYNKIWSESLKGWERGRPRRRWEVIWMDLMETVWGKCGLDECVS